VLQINILPQILISVITAIQHALPAQQDLVALAFLVKAQQEHFNQEAACARLDITTILLFVHVIIKMNIYFLN
jgi:hypothetical protein